MRRALYAFALIAATIALCGRAAEALGPLAGASAVLAALVLLLSARWPGEERGPGLLAFALIVLGTPLLGGLTGGWEASRLVAFTLGATVAALWWESRGEMGLWRALLAAGAAGAATALVPSSVGLLLLLGVAAAFDRAARPARRLGLVTLLWGVGGLAFAVVAGARGSLPAWRAGEACGAMSPQGAWILLVDLFSSERGLLYGAPLLWLGFAGWLTMARQERRAFFACSSAWLLAGIVGVALPAAGGRFDGLVPTLVIGLAGTLAALVRATRRWPLWPMACAGLALIVWNFLFMAQYRGGVIPRDDTVSFPRVTEGAAESVERASGAPLAWPGNWLAAWLYHVPLDRFEWMAGRSVFASAEAVQVSLPLADPRTSLLLLDGWGTPRLHLGRSVRRVAEAARVVVPLSCSEPLDVSLVAAGPGALRLSVNDSVVGTWALEDSFVEHRARVAASAWRCPASGLKIDVAPGGEAWIESLSFVRASGVTREGR